MDISNRSDRRRNVFDIVADLGFLDRKVLPRAEAADIAQQPPALTLVKSPAPPDPEPPAAMKPRPEGPHSELAQTLSEAQQRAAEQRLAAERLLQEAVELERRLADEVAQARAANDQALAEALAVALEESRAAEREADERAGICTQNAVRTATEKAQAEAMQTKHRNERRAAADDVAATEAHLATARRRLEIADDACAESDRHLTEASAAEEAARADAAAAAQTLTNHRGTCEAMEQQLRGIHARAAAFTGAVPSLATVEQLHALETRADAHDAATRIAERRAADAAKRIAERRAADAQRGAAS